MAVNLRSSAISTPGKIVGKQSVSTESNAKPVLTTPMRSENFSILVQLVSVHISAYWNTLEG